MRIVRGLRFVLVASAILLAQGAAAQADNPPLWKVGGSLYLFGSFHMLPPEVQWRTPAVTRAMEQSSVVVLEADVAGAADPKVMQPLMVKYGLLPPGQTLAAILPPQANADMQKLAAELGLPAAGLAAMRPWLASLVLSVQFMASRGFDPNQGVDQQVLAWAQQSGRKLESLESIDTQLRIFADLAREEEIALLAVTVQQIQEMPAILGQMLAAYRKGDLTALEKLLNASLDGQPALRRRVLGDRHRAWLPKIEAMAASGQPHFIVVGAAHVVGADGIIAMLRARGVRTEGP